MRSLNKNKQSFWVVDIVSKSEGLDINGNYTGDFTTVYGTPYQIKMNILPSNSSIREQLFGLGEEFELVGVSTDVELEMDSLLFLSEPVSDFDTTYDYRMVGKQKSLNSILYAFKKRV